MNTDGFKIYNKQFNITPSLIKSLKKSVKKKYAFIFNTPRNDFKRCQSSIRKNAPKQVKQFLCEIETFCKAEMPDLKLVEPVLILSKSGCKKQRLHTDYEPTTELISCPDEHFPCSILIALEPFTNLYVCKSSIRHWEKLNETFQEDKIILMPGDAVIFRGDLFHAGSEYHCENIRLHCYLDSALINRVSNRTWYVPKSFKIYQ